MAVIYKKKTIENILLLASCFVFYLIRGKANHQVLNLKTILIIQHSKLGDMVCTTPMFKAIKEKYPEARVLVMGNAINRELLKYNPSVDGYLVLEKNIFKFLKLLKSEKIDFACLTMPGIIYLAALYLSGIPLITAPYLKSGFSPYITKSYKLLLKLVVPIEYVMGDYVPGGYLKLLSPVGIFSEQTKKYLFFSPAADRKIIDFFDRHHINFENDLVVGITPSVGNKIKLWSADNFAELANFISQKFKATIIIIGSSEDKIQTEKMVARLIPETKTINAVGLFDIDELKALISKLKIFIGVDTGPIYIAEAFNVPTIDIVGPMDESEQPPRGKFNKIVKVPDRVRPELHIMNAKVYNQIEAQRQIDEITPAMAIEAFNQLATELNIIPLI